MDWLWLSEGENKWIEGVCDGSKQEVDVGQTRILHPAAEEDGILAKRNETYDELLA